MIVRERLLYASALSFEAAREVRALPEGHRSRRMHGHSFLAKVRVDIPAGWSSFPGAEVGQLHRCLSEVVAPLDYRCLNESVPEPTDENLAREIWSRLTIPGIESVGVQSTTHEGADLDGSQSAHIWRRYVVESAHRLPNVRAGHKCGRMHGHGFQIILHANQNIAGHSMGVDYDAMDAVWAPVAEEIDHVCLNDVPGLENPTSELIASWLWERLKPQLPELSWVTVYETAQCGANYDGSHYRIWKEMSMDSALMLDRAPHDDRRRRIHGHTYTLRLHIKAPLDSVMGWTVDFGDVKEIFDPIFRRLDHQPLHELPGLEQPDAASLARWILSQSARVLPNIDRVDLYERRGCGVVLSTGESEIALPI